LDANSNGRPDYWTSNSKFTRSSTVKYLGTYSGRHRATDNSGHTISQTVANLIAGRTYSFSGRAYIPSTSDTFTFKLEVRWANSSGSTIRTDVVKTYSNTSTKNVWDNPPATRSMVAPTGAVQAYVRMVVSSLNATIYVDDFVFKEGPVATGTDTIAPTNPASALPETSTELDIPLQEP